MTVKGSQTAPVDVVSPANGARAGSQRSRLGTAAFPLAVTAFIVVLWAVLTMTQTVDTWVSLAGGRHLAAHGVSTVDPFSFASRAPSGTVLLRDGWVNQNWLTHRLLFALASTFGLDALVALKATIYTLVLVLLVAAARAGGAHSSVALLLAAGSIAAGRTFFEVRAQDLTNLLAAALILLIVLAEQRDRRWRLASIPLLAVWANVHGGFTWGLLVLWAFAGAELIAVLQRTKGERRAISLASGWPGVALAATAACAAASPFGLNNLLHTLQVTIGPASREWRTVQEWQPLTTLPLAQKAVFAIAVAGFALSWAAALARRRARASSARYADHGDARLDVVGGVILAATCIMALVSRRFLPMAYLVGAPLVARWVSAVIPTGLRTARAPLHRGTMEVQRRRGADALVLACWLVAVGAGSTLAFRFARVYLGPWSVSPTRTTLADRSLQAFRQPWDACTFVRTSSLRGRLFTSWEEAGFWEWCQVPDSASGRLPMQVLIDARAQAAFEIEALRVYHDLTSGGPAGAAVDSAGRDPSAAELDAMRSHLVARLRELGIHLIHVSPDMLETGLGRAAFSLPGWEPVYVDAHHALVIDAGSDDGERLVRAVDAGKAEFPTEVAAALTRAYRLLRQFKPEPTLQAFDLARRAFEIEPSPRALGYVAACVQLPPLREAVVRYCSRALADIVTEADRLKMQHGYFQRVMSAIAALQFLTDTEELQAEESWRQWARAQLEFLASELDDAEAAATW